MTLKKGTTADDKRSTAPTIRARAKAPTDTSRRKPKTGRGTTSAKTGISIIPANPTYPWAETTEFRSGLRVDDNFATPRDTGSPIPAPRAVPPLSTLRFPAVQEAPRSVDLYQVLAVAILGYQIITVTAHSGIPTGVLFLMGDLLAFLLGVKMLERKRNG